MLFYSSTPPSLPDVVVMVVEGDEESLGNRFGLSKPGSARNDEAGNKRILIGPVRVMIIPPATDGVNMSTISPSRRMIRVAHMYPVLGCVRLLGRLVFGYTRRYTA